jgi:hypothetical protein
MPQQDGHRAYPMAEFQAYLTHRVMHEPASGNPMLKCIRDLARQVHDAGDTELPTVEACVRRLCAAALSLGASETFNKVFQNQNNVGQELYESHLLAAAIFTNNVPVVKQCIERKNWDMPGSWHWYGRSFFFGDYVDVAGKFGRPELLAFLMGWQGHIFSMDILRRILFEPVIRSGRVDIVRFVWLFGRETGTRFNERCLHQAWTLENALGYASNPEVYHLLQKLRLDCYHKPDAAIPRQHGLVCCANSGVLALVEDHIQHGACAGGDKAYRGLPLDNEPVITACRRGHTAVVEFLLKHGAFPCDTVAIAASHFRTELVQRLLDFGVRPTGAIAKGARVGSLDIVRLLLDSGVDPNESVGKEHPLVCAISSEHTAMFDLLLEHGAILQRDTVRHCVQEAKAHGLESMLRLLEERILLQARANKPNLLEQKGVDIGA